MPDIITHVPNAEEARLWAQQQQLAPDGPETNPDLMPRVINVAEQVGIDPSALQQENLRVQNAAERPVVIDVNTAAEIDDQGLLGIVEVGNSPVKIYGYKEDGRLVPGVFTLAAGDYREPAAGEEHWARNIQLYPLSTGDSVAFGRTAKTAKVLGLEKDTLVSRNHFSATVTPEGKLVIADLESTNGTSVITAEKDQTEALEKTIPRPIAQEIGSVATAEVFAAPDTKERIINGVRFRLDGAIPVGGREVYMFTTTNKNGESRKIGVYKSVSEGGMRVATGFEMSGRFMKGAESSPFAQYTQDTQLHPEFANAVREMTFAQDLPVASVESFTYGQKAVAAIEKEFEEKVSIEGFHDKKLNKLLTEVRAGMLSPGTLRSTMDDHRFESNTPLENYVAELNAQLLKSGAIPAFDKPIRAELDTHQLLGNIKREVFAHNVKGIAYEWHIGSDDSGRVWIDRIRRADAKVSDYGTDDKLVFSGVLTSKPVDYSQQTDAVPDSMKHDISGTDYTDISMFLDKLEPIKHYRAQRGVNRR